MKQFNFLSLIFLFYFANLQNNFLFGQNYTNNIFNQNFSQIYSKFLNDNDFGKNADSYVWQHACPNDSFSELILSWNAFRPKKGKFSFYVSIKHNYWSHWYKIGEWKPNFQQTFVNTSNLFVHVKHVRVELRKKRMGDAFRIKVKAEGGANIKDVKALFACTSNVKHFKVEKNNFDLPSLRVRNVPKQSQMVLKHSRACDLCSPTSLGMIVNYFLKNNSNELQNYIPYFADKVHDDSYLDIYGNWVLNVAQAFDSSNGKVFYRVERFNSFNDLYDCFKKGIPVAVSVRGYMRGAAKRYDNGHFIVVVGWDNQKKAVLCIDPAFNATAKVLRAYRIKDFLRAWGISRNLSYVPIPKSM